MLLFLCNNGISELFTSSYFYYFYHFSEIWVTYCKLKLLSWNKSCTASRWMSLAKQALWRRPTDLWLPASASLRLRAFSGGQGPPWVSPAGQILEGTALHPSMTAVGWCLNSTAPCPLGGKLWGACPTLTPRVPKSRGLSGHSQQRPVAPLKVCLPLPVSHPHSPTRGPGITSHINSWKTNPHLGRMPIPNTDSVAGFWERCLSWCREWAGRETLWARRSAWWEIQSYRSKSRDSSLSQRRTNMCSRARLPGDIFLKILWHWEEAAIMERVRLCWTSSYLLYVIILLLLLLLRKHSESILISE